MRKSLFSVIIFVVPLGAFAMAGMAQAQYPTKPIRLVVPATAGDGSDVLGRLVGRHLGEALGQSVVIENRPGAGGSIAGAAVTTSAPDGYTLMLANGSSHSVTPALYPKLPYDSMRDFAPVSLLAVSPNLLVVHPSVPAANIGEFLAYARANPGKLNIAAAGNGSLSHLSVELFRSMAKIDIVNVGYKGAAPALNDLVAGQVSAVIINIPSTLALVQAGKLRALAVTSAKRTSLLPDLPTLSEAGLSGYDTIAWFGLAAPAKTPDDVIRKLNAETVKVMARPDVRESLVRLGAEASTNTPEQFAGFMRTELAKYSKIIKDAGIKVE